MALQRSGYPSAWCQTCSIRVCPLHDPLEVEVQLYTLQKKLLGDVVCLRSLIPGNQGGGAPDPPVCSPGRRCPPTYDIQFLTASNEKPLGNDLYSHPDISPARWGLSAPSHCVNTTT